MFEQSMVDTRGVSKPWTLVAMTGQVVAVGIGLMIPMIHPEVLNAPRMLISVVYHTPVAEPEIHVAQTAAVPTGGSGPVYSAARPRVFQAPTRIPTGVAVIIDEPGMQVTPFTFGRSAAGGVDLGPGVPFATGDGIPGVGPPAPVPMSKPAEVAPPAVTPRVRVGGLVQEAKMIRRVLPVYPLLAKTARIQGVVKLEGIISRDGTIQQLRVVSGHPLLVQSALDAVKQWVYRPTHLNGEPVEVVSPIDVNFILSN